MHPRTTALLENLDRAEWFCAVGVPDSKKVVVVASWNEAIKSCNTIEWENIGIENANKLSRPVARIDRERFERWNEIVREIKPSVIALVERKIAAVEREHALPKVFRHAVEWDILSAYLEAEYSDLVPLGFYTELASWYMKGHFPCGWEGEYPDGRLIVY